MFLSNPRQSFLLLAVCVTFLQACGGSQTSENKDISLTGDTKSEFPFSTKEPEVYQGDFVVSSGKYEDHTFVARKGDKWRYDVDHNGAPELSQIKTDKFYTVNHKKKIYTQNPEGSNDPYLYVNLGYSFIWGKEYREFEEIGRDGGIIKYKVRETKFSKDDILISIDAASGMVVRQEFRSMIGETEAGSQIAYIYEIRNLKLDVDDSVFAIPEGYRKVSQDEYRSLLKQK